MLGSVISAPVCLHCGQSKRSKGKYCSDSCRAKASHSRRFVRKPERKVLAPNLQRRAFQLAALWMAGRLA
jgi:tRNA(Ile2) C34 agmatinyltransferase TiaS